MVQVKKLTEDALLEDVLLGGVYLAEVKGNTAVLSPNVKVPFRHSDGVFPVKVAKVSNEGIILQEVQEEYTVEVEKESHPALLADNPDVAALSEDMHVAVKLMKAAVRFRDLIILRHHADADGYSAAIALEDALTPLIMEQTERTWQVFKRMPTKIPYYDYGDALRDLSLVLDQVAMGRKPLVIVADTGSGEDSLLSLRRLRQAGARIIVIDHHPASPEVDKVVDVHVNPHRKGLSGNVTAGMLCCEIANMLLPKMRKEWCHLAAVSTIADKSSIMDYVKKQGIPEGDLRKIASCVDFEAHTLKFMESDTIKDILMGKREIIDLLWNELEERRAGLKFAAAKYGHVQNAVLEDVECKTITLDLEKTQDSEYPGSKILSILHSMHEGPRVSMGVHRDFVTFRADGVPFSFVDLMEHLKLQFPYALISGGGHPHAGTVKFLPAAKDEVTREIRRYLRLS